MLTGMRKFAAAAATDQVGMLAKIEAPTLITFGRDDRVTPARQRARADAASSATCEVHIFPNCGHWAMIERKDEFESVVLSFLGRDPIQP